VAMFEVDGLKNLIYC